MSRQIEKYERVVRYDVVVTDSSANDARGSKKKLPPFIST
jgi:hypothetical protein